MNGKQYAGPIERAVTVLADEAILSGTLTLPGDALALVLVALPSGSGRLSPRNRRLARRLHGARLGTLLLDLMTRPEEGLDLEQRQVGSNVAALTRRLEGAIDWVGSDPETAGLCLGLLAAGTAAASALVAAVERPGRVRAVASKGGRPHLAGAALSRVDVPTLFIVGAEDPELVALNRQARRAMPRPAEIRLIEGASHVFDEPGALEAVADAAARFFERHLLPHAPVPGDARIPQEGSRAEGAGLPPSSS